MLPKVILGRCLPGPAEEDPEAEAPLATCPGITGISAGGPSVAPSKAPLCFSLVGFPLKLSRRALVGHRISPAAVEQADPQGCLLVRGKRADHVHLGELR